VQTFVLSCDLGIAKPDPAPFEIACERLGVLPERTLMVGNNRLADSGSICVGCHCLILPPVPPAACARRWTWPGSAGRSDRRIHYSAVGAGWSSRPARVPSVRPSHCP
jgi:FMN phosphatase YigB (HAD superfamily)